MILPETRLQRKPFSQFHRLLRAHQSQTRMRCHRVDPFLNLEGFFTTGRHRERANIETDEASQIHTLLKWRFACWGITNVERYPLWRGCRLEGELNPPWEHEKAICTASLFVQLHHPVFNQWILALLFFKQLHKKVCLPSPLPSKCLSCSILFASTQLGEQCCVIPSRLVFFVSLQLTCPLILF